MAQKQGEAPRINNSNNSSRILPDMEGKCLKCVKHKHQPGQKCTAQLQRCKACGKLGHFAKVCLTTRRQQGGSKMVGIIQAQEKYEETFVDEIGRNQSTQHGQSHQHIEKTATGSANSNSREKPQVQHSP